MKYYPIAMCKSPLSALSFNLVSYLSEYLNINHSSLPTRILSLSPTKKMINLLLSELLAYLSSNAIGFPLDYLSEINTS